MPTAVIAVAEEAPFRFDLDTFTATVRQRWPNARFVPATGRVASVTRGQWQIPDADSWPDQVLVEFDIEGQGLMLDGPEDDLRAAVIHRRDPRTPLVERTRGEHEHQIRVLTRMAFGFKSPQALIALAMLNLGGYCPPLPGRKTR